MGVGAVRARLGRKPVHLALLLSTLLLTVMACAIGAPQGASESPVPPVASAMPEASTSVGRTKAELAQATVQVLALARVGGSLEPLWSGSGSVIRPEGVILTNAHVADKRYGDYDALAIAMTLRTDRPPELEYLAEVQASDAVLDLAILRILSDLEGQPVDVDFPYVPLGDSDLLEIGDSLSILGYPGIGGETITFTEGAVAGFTLERGIEGRAWIKTDATIAGGNSGGMGVNDQGFLIGVPTIVTSGSEYGQPVDCRPLADTDRDGDIDEQDTCVPVGGFINALRPINLARPLIDSLAGGPPVGSGPSTRPSGGYDLTKVTFSNLLFSDGVTEDNQPTQLWYALPNGATQLCAFWDYQNMINGMLWSSHWFVDGKLSERSSVLGQTWGGGANGNWWTCLSDDQGIASGLYELVLEVEGKVLVTEAVFVGGHHAAAEFTLANSSGAAICGVFLSPTGANNWGQNDLPPGGEVAPSQSRVIPTVTGTYDLLILNCEGAAVLDAHGLDVLEKFTYTVKG